MNHKDELDIPTERLDVDTQIAKPARPHLDAFVIYHKDGRHYGAVISHVWNDTCVNLRYVDEDGHSFADTSVLFSESPTDQARSWSWPKHA